MCIIIDVNTAPLVFQPPSDPDFRPVFLWLTEPSKNGRVVIGGRLAHELITNDAIRRYLRTLQQAGRAVTFPDPIIDAETNRVRALGICCSNDEHIIALARISGARTVCSRDRALHADFKNRQLINNPAGRIYQNATHSRLLRHTRACKKNLAGN